MGAGGLALVNVANAAAPSVIATAPIDATVVNAYEGVAYANDGDTLDAIDLATGTLLQRLAIGAAGITGIARDGSMLYLMDASNTLTTIDLSSGQMVEDGSITLSQGGGGLTVADGIAYVPTNDVYSGGYTTVDVSNPAAPKVIATPADTGIESAAIALNGSGLAVAVGMDGGGSVGVVAADVVNVSDPTNTGQFVTRYTLPGSGQGTSTEPFDVAIADGVAFIADGSSGLQVLDYLPFDTAGIPPTVSITTPPADEDPNTPGIQIQEGSTVSLAATVADDVQVRNVEVLVNGVVQSNDISSVRSS